MEGTLLGPYRVIDALGSGGMGTVFRAEVEGRVPGLEPGREVALKVIHAHLLKRRGFFQRFRREADIGRSVEHANVVRTYLADATLVDGARQPYLVMEYVKGQTLRDLLEELDRVPEELCRHIGREVAKGLAAIHEAGVIHRDLKPENVLITPEHVVKIMDLGVARLQDEAIRLSQTGAFVGSLEYAAPEQFGFPDAEPDARADLHALGVLLYELSAGQHPYRDEDASRVLRNILDRTPRRAGEINPQLSPFFEEVVHTLIAKDREKRFSTAAELADVFEAREDSAWWEARAQALRNRTKRPLRRIRIPRETALYGRDGDLARLRAAYERVQVGDGQVLLIEGEAGIGKTRLVDEFVGRLQQEGEDLNFLYGSYPPGGAATAAGAFSTAYCEQFGSTGLEETLRDYLKVTPVLVPAFAALLRGVPPSGLEVALTKDSLQTVFVHATQALAAERPTVVLIDDLHFAPEDGRALFASLALALPGHPVLLIGTMRPGVPEDWIADVQRQDHAAWTSLSRLGPKDLANLLEDAFHSKRLSDELGMQIARKSDGNPFFAFEIIRGLKEGQFITQKPDGTWVTTQVIQDIQVPSSVLDLVQARIADLDKEERELLDVAACCGFQFDPGLVAAALDVELVPSLRQLAHLETKHRIVRSSGRRFVFDHHQVQEALYGALPDLLREAYHAAIAEALETRAGAVEGGEPGDLDGALCVDLCEHALKGAEGERALRYLDAALDHLEKGYLNDQAISLADRALEVPGLLQGEERLDVLLRKDARFHLLGRSLAQEPGLAEARALAEASGEGALVARVETATGNAAYELGRFDEARERHERARAIAREIGDAKSEARASRSLGGVGWATGRYAEAREDLERSLAIAREIGDRQEEARATRSLGSLSNALGHHDEARGHHERALVLSREIGDRQGEAIATAGLGHVELALGHYDEARAHFERDLAIDREIGDRRGEGTATGALGLVFRALGQNENAREQHERALAIARETGDPQGEARATGSLGNVLHNLGRYAEARAQYERWLAIARGTGDRRGEGAAAENLGLVCVGLGRHEDARAHHTHALEIAREIGEQRLEAHAVGGLGTVAEADGDPEAAGRFAHEALALFRELDLPSGIASALVLLGRLHEARGRPDASRTCLEEARILSLALGDPTGIVMATCHLAALPDGDVAEGLSAFEEHGERLGHAERMESHFLLWKATGRAGSRDEARRLLDHLVRHVPDEDRPSLLENVPLHRAILDA